MKLIWLIFTSLLVLSTPALAQEVPAGVTPDSPFYFLDTALDQIRLLLTFDNTAKAKVGLEIAQERLSEVKVMIETKKLNEAQTARNEHSNVLATIRSSIASLSRANSTQEIEEEIELEKELENHERRVKSVTNELEIKIKGNVTSEQQALVDSILSSLQNVTGEVKVEIKFKQNATKVKIKIETGKNETEIEDEVKEIEEAQNLTQLKKDKAQEQINDAQEEISNLEGLIAKTNLTQANKTSVDVLFNQSKSHLAKALTAFNQSDFGEAYGQANSAEQLAKNGQRILEKSSEKQKPTEAESKKMNETEKRSSSNETTTSTSTNKTKEDREKESSENKTKTNTTTTKGPKED